MAAYLVTYDLNHQKEWGDYTELTDVLKGLGAFKTQKSVWLLAHASKAQDLYSRLRKHMHNDDFLYIAQLAKGINWQSMSLKGTNDWMKKNVGDSP